MPDVNDANKENADFGLPNGKSEEEFLSEMRERAQWCFDADSALVTLAQKDIKFCDIPGNQWDEYTRNERRGRPCYEFNRARKQVQQIINEEKQNRPSIKIRAVRDATEDDADLRQGIIRNIEASSNAELAYDTAFDFAVKGGKGAWRIKTEWSADDAFDQEIVIETLTDPFMVSLDPSATTFEQRDARFGFVFTVLPRSEFASRYPDADAVSFGTMRGSQSYNWADWWGEDTVRIAEYWFKVPGEREIWLLSDGSTVNAKDAEPLMPLLAQQGVTVLRKRVVKLERVYSCIASGSQILEPPTEWAGENIPLIVVWGNLSRVDGKPYWCGEIRFMRDSQATYNYERSTMIEVIADQPKMPLMAAADAIEGYESDYEQLGVSKRPVLLYNHLAGHPNGGMPQRVAPPAFPVAFAQAAQISAEDISATSNVYPSQMGDRSNEISGRAINARNAQGGVANFGYMDNLAKALRYTGEQLNELIPKIYDTEREIRLMGVDGAAKIVKINHAVQNPQTGQWETANDLSRGKYDITVDIGPSYTTQRMETAEAMSQMAQVPGPFQPLIQYAYLKSLDVPDIDDVQEAARMMLVKQGVLPPSEGDNLPPPHPPQPNPVVMATAQLKAAQAQKAQAEAVQTRVQTEQTIANAPLTVQHAQATAAKDMADAAHSHFKTAKEAAEAAAKIPPLPPNPSIPQMPNRATLPLGSPGQF